MNRRLVVLAALALLVGVAAGAPATIAVFTSNRTTTGTFGTATIAPPTSLAGTGGTLATLGWTASTSASATGYHLLRSATSGSGYSQVAAVTPVSATTTTDSPAAGTWYYVLQTYLGTWTSASSNEASVIVGAPVTTALQGCTSNAPVTTGSGDNNGYQTNPAKACALDGGIAKDASSGTSTVNSCTNTGKDRHTFWGYAFGLPGAVTSINGIALQVVAGENNVTGTTLLCVEVSGDAGVTWSAAKSATLTATALTAYTLGGTSDDWGHGAWTPAQLSATNFRVRVTDVATITTKIFRLDYLGARVTYLP
jgi:hypothetical protein